MKKILLLIIIILVTSCGQKTKYNEEKISKEIQGYLEEKYNSSYDFIESGGPGGSSIIDFNFMDSENSDKNGQLQIIVKWDVNKGIVSDSEKYLSCDLEYEIENLKKEALNYLEEKYNEEFTYIRNVCYLKRVNLIFEIKDKKNYKNIIVIRYADGSMNDNYGK